MRTGKLKKLLGRWALISCGGAMLSTAQAQIYWNGGNGSWTDTTKWSTGSVPSSTTDVVFDSANGVQTITLGNTAEVKSLLFNNTALTTLSTGTLKLYNGLIIDAASGGVTWSSGNVVIMNSQTWTNNAAAGKLVLPTTVTAGDSDVTLTINSAFASNTSVFANLFKDSANGKLSLVFNNANFDWKGVQSYSGNTTFESGYVKLSVSNATGIFGSGTVFLGGGSGVTLAAAASGTNVLINDIVVKAGSTVVSAIISNDKYLVLNGNISLSSTLSLSAGSSSTVNSLLANGVISGVGGLLINASKAGSDVTFAGANSYNGDTSLTTNATLKITNDQALGLSGNKVHMGNSSVLEYTGNSNGTTNQVIGLNGGAKQTATLRASGAGAWNVTQAIDMNDGGSQDRTLVLAGTSTALNTVSGAITNATGKLTSVTKSDAGTWVLSGINTYSGSTTVSAGTLLINGNSSGVTNNVGVSSGARLGGTGTIGGATTLSGAAVLVPGGDNVIGTFTFSNGLSLSDGSILNFDLGGALGDKIVISGGSFLSGGISTIDLNVLSGLTAGTYTLLDWSSVTGSTINLSNFVLDTGSSTIGTLSLSGNSLVLNVTVIPEPSTWVLMTVGVVVLAWTVRRRAAKV
ncbi:MAG: autotransporter-associated beta strand repeat-containing protein [Verrucomicrobiales bacterium]|jgi:autotransporter-associated beta strand protein|nr:autotransporter-associated beta strand repeat-containing protein [Verrucomicrobiales bacterium]